MVLIFIVRQKVLGSGCWAAVPPFVPAPTPPPPPTPAPPTPPPLCKGKIVSSCSEIEDKNQHRKGCIGDGFIKKSYGYYQCISFCFDNDDCECTWSDSTSINTQCLDASNVEFIEIIA